MAQRLALLVALIVAPSLAAAQVITVTESHDQDNIINIAECTGQVTDQLSFTWTVSTTSLTGTYDLWVSDQTGCPTAGLYTTTAHSVSIASAVSATSLSNFISVPTMLGQIGIACPGPATSVFVCLFPSGTSGTSGTVSSASAIGTIPLDMETPPAPVANTPTPGDSALNVSWSQGSGAADAGTAGAAASYNIYCDVHPAVSPITKKCGEVTGTGTTSTRIDGLTNGTEYDVEVTALSVGSNESAHSNTVTAAPVQVNDFWRLYRDAGGREQGGCATGAAGLTALLALVPLVWRRRRRRP